MNLRKASVNNITPSKMFRMSLYAFLFGIGIGFLPLLTFFLVVCGAVTVVVIYKTHSLPVLLLICCLGVTTGIWRYQASMPRVDHSFIGSYNGQAVSLKGHIKEVDPRIDHAKITVQKVSIHHLPVQGDVLIKVPLYPELIPGGLVEMTCVLRAPEAFNGFAYDRYLAKEGIYALCAKPTAFRYQAPDRYHWRAVLWRVEQKIQRNIVSGMPEPEAGILAATLLDNRRGIPDDVMEDFSDSGLTHIIAISGAHITILISAVLSIGFALYGSRRQLFWIITALLICYVFLIGFPASAVRAAVMGWTFALGNYLGRLNNSSNAVLFSAAVMVAVNPKILADDIGFQLSFAAVLGLLYFNTFFTDLLARFGSRTNVIVQSLSMTLSAQVATAPLILYHFSRLSYISPLANMVAVPLSPFILLFGVAGVIAGLIAPWFSWYVYLPVYLFIKTTVLLASMFSQLQEFLYGFMV